MCVVAIDAVMQSEAAFLPLRLWEKRRPLGDHLHIGVVLSGLAELIIHSSERELSGLRLCQKKRDERLEPCIEFPESSNRSGELVRGDGLAGTKQASDVDELIVAGFKEDAVESTFVDESLDQRNFEGLGVTVSMGIALAQHRYLAMADILGDGGESVLIRDRGRSCKGGMWMSTAQKQHSHGHRQDLHLYIMCAEDANQASAKASASRV